MNTALVNHIDASFGGKAIRFELKRDDIVALENTLGGSAFHTLKRLAANVWTMREVQIVLSAAIPPESAGRDPNSPEAMIARMNRAIPGGMANATLCESPRVLAVLRENPPARYAVLALSVLEAAFFGVEPADAVFDEGATEEAA